MQRVGKIEYPAFLLAGLVSVLQQENPGKAWAVLTEIVAGIACVSVRSNLCGLSFATMWVLLSSVLVHLFSHPFSPLTVDKREKKEREGRKEILRG